MLSALMMAIGLFKSSPGFAGGIGCSTGLGLGLGLGLGPEGAGVVGFSVGEGTGVCGFDSDFTSGIVTGFGADTGVWGFGSGFISGGTSLASDCAGGVMGFGAGAGVGIG